MHFYKSTLSLHVFLNFHLFLILGSSSLTYDIPHSLLSFDIRSVTPAAWTASADLLNFEEKNWSKNMLDLSKTTKIRFLFWFPRLKRIIILFVRHFDNMSASQDQFDLSLYCNPLYVPSYVRLFVGWSVCKPVIISC